MMSATLHTHFDRVRQHGRDKALGRRRASSLLGLLAALILAGSEPVASQQFTTLYSFSALSLTNADGASPFGSVIQGKDGNLYGTAFYGGVYGSGTLFKITTSGAFSTLYSFSALSHGNYGTNSDGAFPSGSLIQASDGNLYGTTVYGGVYGDGTVFKISTSGVLTSLHSFANGNVGVDPQGLIQAGDGNFYGTTEYGGAWGTQFGGYGTIFKITRNGAFTPLHSFTGGAGGDSPGGPLLQASDGALYGTTYQGGATDNGTLFRITLGGTFTTLYAFGSDWSSTLYLYLDGTNPEGALIQADDGALYGMTNGQTGSIYKITLAGKLTTLYNFTGGTDGNYPVAGLIQASDGNLYGMTPFGGGTSSLDPGGSGVIFRITPSGAYTVLYTFSDFDSNGLNKDGVYPRGALMEASDHKLYGEASAGGLNGSGTLFCLDVGISPMPILTGISPSYANAGGPGFTLKVTGASFQTFSTVNWNGDPLQTTFVSPTALTATVPATLITSAGKASVSVVTGAGGGTSKAKPFTLLVTTVKLKTVGITRDTGKNTLTAVVTLSNTGFLSASSTSVTKATLNAVSATNLPQSAGSITAGSTGTATLVFPGSAGTSGQKVALKLSGTFTRGTFSGSLNVKLP